MSAIRSLDKDPFDQLAGVLVDEAFQIIRAAIIPVALVRKESAYVAHSNSWRFLLRDKVWSFPGVRDVTDELRAIALNI